jgi:hypothetical protein
LFAGGIIKQWTIQEISIFRNSSHFKWRTDNFERNPSNRNMIERVNSVTVPVFYVLKILLHSFDNIFETWIIFTSYYILKDEFKMFHFGKFCIIFFTDPDFTFRSCFLDYRSPHFRIQIKWGKERKRMTQAEKLVLSGRKGQILTRKCPELIFNN